MPALQINIKSYYEVPTVGLLSVGNAPAKSQDLKGEIATEITWAKVHIHTAKKSLAQSCQAMCLSSHSMVMAHSPLPCSLSRRSINRAFNGN